VSERIQGTVKFFNSGKGYGFIERKDGEKDVFVHHSAIEEKDENGRSNLYEDQEVEFGTEESDRGLRATNVVKL
jgi:CspA family cold shock protein